MRKRHDRQFERKMMPRSEAHYAGDLMDSPEWDQRRRKPSKEDEPT